MLLFAGLDSALGILGRWVWGSGPRVAPAGAREHRQQENSAEEDAVLAESGNLMRNPSAAVVVDSWPQVDNKKLDLESKYIESIDATKLSRFIEINSLHLVTEYNPATVIGLFNSMIQIHLLLMMNKASPEYEESMSRYQKAAKLFQGKILFVLVDSGVEANGKVISFFKLKKSQLPALAIYRTVDEEWDTLPMAEVSVEHVQNFCDGFLKGKRLKENHESEEKTPKVEL
uniref:endoplasmic reticulum resident protein 27-like n=1 Tax=Nyctereutes procyonoides TaxID=34880 RepID=UPI002444AF87|nr:endoplasmic reticulum resident protein 27-like [Nyctereutes procyonoides]